VSLKAEGMNNAPTFVFCLPLFFSYLGPLCLVGLLVDGIAVVGINVGDPAGGVGKGVGIFVGLGV
jgi:hypothetical protein